MPAYYAIAVPVPLHKTFEYAYDGSRELEPGVRVRVAFGRQQLIGVVMHRVEQPSFDPKKIKPLQDVLDDKPLADKTLWALANWVVRYYQQPPGELLALLFPTKLRKGGVAELVGQKYFRLTDVGRAYKPEQLKRAAKQQSILMLMQEVGRAMLPSEIQTQIDSAASALRALQEKGLIEPTTRPKQWLSQLSQPIQTIELTEEQRLAIDSVAGAFGHFQAFLLEGITGSGKTEVYLQLIEQLLLKEQQVLLLVPEIGLTPQLLQRVRQRIKAPVVVMHSGLGETERCDAWLQAQSGEAAVVIGTRSALFTPFKRLGLILIDEEHDASFKQQEGCRYSARDSAVQYAHLNAVPILLGTATPSLESLHNAQSGKYQKLSLTKRAGDAVSPRFEVIDIRSVGLQDGVSPRLVVMMREHLQQQGQVLLFLNRRGYAPVFMCHDCGWMAECKHCDARMTLHARQQVLRCHHCGWQTRVVLQCPSCESTDFTSVGVGTEQVEQFLRREFPAYVVDRVDRDTVTTAKQLDKALAKFTSGETQILLGTQMLAKGHHVPAVTLVGILNVDNGLFGLDFRAAERLGQLVIQVAGRAGRGAKQGTVALQTHFPEHPQLQRLLCNGYAPFANELMEERRLIGFPPYAHMAVLRAEALNVSLALDFLRAVAEQIKQLDTQVSCWGPLPTAMVRKAKYYRAVLTLQSVSRPALQQVFARLLPMLDDMELAKRVRWLVDVDPQDVL